MKFNHSSRTKIIDEISELFDTVKLIKRQSRYLKWIEVLDTILIIEFLHKTFLKCMSKFSIMELYQMSIRLLYSVYVRLETLDSKHLRSWNKGLKNQEVS